MREPTERRPRPRRRAARAGAALALLATAGLAVASSPAAPRASAGRAPAGLEVAVTIDDLPWNGEVAPGEPRTAATRRLLDVLARHRAPAVGFVNCRLVRPDEPILPMWRDAGMELGNHTASHVNLDRTSPAAWAADVEACHELLTRFLGRPPRFFRFPYLHEGATRERQAFARRTLARLGYTNASVTIDNSEFLLAAAYGRAARVGDSARQRAIAEEYVRHLTAALDHFDRAAREAFGRRIPQVLLLHANLLAADRLDGVLAAYEGRGARFVGLAAALSDPVFRREPQYVGPEGLSWIYRVSPRALRDLGAWDDREAAAITARFASR